MSTGSNTATTAANQAAQQQSSINNNVNAINSAFANRQGQYNSYLSALNSSYQTQLNQQQQTASRNLKFALAGNGMTGSSVAADQGGQLQQQMEQGQLSASEQAQAKLASLESSDQSEKQQLISLAQSGANIGNAAEQTATALQTNIQNADAALAPNALGNAFGGITNTINSMNTAAQTRLGLKAAQAYTNPFSNTATTSSGYGGSGSGT
jgi:hypothetical protein